MAIILIACMANNGVIGREGKIPWHLPTDLQRFKKMTMRNSIIMGSKTYESIGRPLPDRRNIVLSRSKELLHYDKDFKGEPVVVQDKHHALTIGKMYNDQYIIGGEEIYKLFMEDADKLCLSVLPVDYEGDAYFPEIDLNIWKASSTELVKDDEMYYKYIEFERITQDRSLPQ